MLMGCVELMKAEDTPDHRKMFTEELVKAEFLSPALMNPEPEDLGDGKLKPKEGTKVQFPMLATPEGKKFLMAFTDAKEYQKWQEKTGKEMPYFALKFDDYARLLFAKDSQGNLNPGLGFVINPVSDNVVVGKELVANIMAIRIAQAKKQAENKKNAAGMPGEGPQA